METSVITTARDFFLNRQTIFFLENIVIRASNNLKVSVKLSLAFALFASLGTETALFLTWLAIRYNNRFQLKSFKIGLSQSLAFVGKELKPLASSIYESPIKPKMRIQITYFLQTFWVCDQILKGRY